MKFKDVLKGYLKKRKMSARELTRRWSEMTGSKFNENVVSRWVNGVCVPNVANSEVLAEILVIDRLALLAFRFGCTADNRAGTSARAAELAGEYLKRDLDRVV